MHGNLPTLQFHIAYSTNCKHTVLCVREFHQILRDIGTVLSVLQTLLVRKPTKLLKYQEDVAKAWWQTWLHEKLLDFIPRPKKWRVTSYTPKPGDIVVFPRNEGEINLGQPAWRIGRVKDVHVSHDNIARRVTLEYKNQNEGVFRTTNRSVRSIAILHKEGDLELVQELNQAAKAANIHYLSTQTLYQA